MKALLRCDGLRVGKQRKISDLRWLALLTIWCMWFLKFSLELINTPKSLTVSTCAIILNPSEKGEAILYSTSGAFSYSSTYSLTEICDSLSLNGI